MKPIGLQLFTLRERLGESKEQFLATLRQVADIGYKGVEGGTSNAKEYGFSVAEYRDLIRELGMEFTSAPGPKGDLANLDAVTETAKTLDCDLLMTGFGPDRFRDLETIRDTARNINRMTDALTGTGLRIALHNHYWEFTEVEGRLGHDWIAELCPTVLFELDIFWAANFGANDPAEQLAKFAARAPLLHVKDGPLVAPKTGEKAMMSAVGAGDIDMAAAIGAADESVTRWLVVEIDRCPGDRMAAVEKSYRYLAENGLGEGTR